MKTASGLTWIILSFTILITLNHSCAKQTELISETLKTTHLPKSNQQWMNPHIKSKEIQVKFSSPIVLAGILCSIAASISSAGGIGGGGLFIPILALVAGLDLKTASSFSAFMVTGGSVANVICSLCLTSSKLGGKSSIDYDIALLSQPFMLLGVSVGVICNLVFPEWLITILFAIFLAWSTIKTCKNGVLCWKFESGVGRNGCRRLENGLVRNESIDEEPLLGLEEKCNMGIPWMKLGALVMIWCSFFLIYLLRGNRYGQSIIVMEPCGMGYWVLSSFQIPVAIVFTTWILQRTESPQDRTLYQQEVDDQTRDRPPSKLIFPMMALIAGNLGGLFGIGGGMLISPLLLHVGILPEVTAATCAFMVFFSSSMSAFQYLLLGMEHTSIALTFTVICFVASLVGVVVIQRVIQKYGRASLIVFSVSIVMALSTVLITSFGAMGVWRDYTTGKYMGFKRPC